MSTLPRHRSFGYQVNHLARLFARSLDRRINPLGVTTGQMPALMALLDEDGITQKELRSRVQVEQPTLANTLNRMERDGLIRREPDPQDRRSIRLYLTDAARCLSEPVVAEAMTVNATAIDGLSDEEKETALTLLARMIGNLQDDQEEKS